MVTPTSNLIHQIIWSIFIKQSYDISPWTVSYLYEHEANKDTGMDTDKDLSQLETPGS